jgi:hypothetical protein
VPTYITSTHKNARVTRTQAENRQNRRLRGATKCVKNRRGGKLQFAMEIKKSKSIAEREVHSHTRTVLYSVAVCWTHCEWCSLDYSLPIALLLTKRHWSRANKVEPQNRQPDSTDGRTSGHPARRENCAAKSSLSRLPTAKHSAGCISVGSVALEPNFVSAPHLFSVFLSPQSCAEGLLAKRAGSR